jgi:hypothetical protein
MFLFLDQIANGFLQTLPGHHPVEALQGLLGHAKIDPRHPPLDGGTVGVEIGRKRVSLHVQNINMFINNEQRQILIYGPLTPCNPLLT